MQTEHVGSRGVRTFDVLPRPIVEDSHAEHEADSGDFPHGRESGLQWAARLRGHPHLRQARLVKTNVQGPVQEPQPVSTRVLDGTATMVPVAIPCSGRHILFPEKPENCDVDQASAVLLEKRGGKAGGSTLLWNLCAFAGSGEGLPGVSDTVVGSILYRVLARLVNSNPRKAKRRNPRDAITNHSRLIRLAFMLRWLPNLDWPKLFGTLASMIAKRILSSEQIHKTVKKEW
jgi:hypothetical protein